MYPETVLQWIGACLLVFGIIVGVAALALWIEHRIGGKR